MDLEPGIIDIVRSTIDRPTVKRPMICCFFCLFVCFACISVCACFIFYYYYWHRKLMRTGRWLVFILLYFNFLFKVGLYCLVNASNAPATSL